MSTDLISVRSRLLSRREVLRRGFLGLGVLGVGPSLYGCGGKGPTQRFSNVANLGPLLAPDGNGVRLPRGFTSRVVARSNEMPVLSSDYVWHTWPDGGAVFATGDGGWIYVSNSELPVGEGGVGALRFAAGGNVVDAYSILAGTNRNCAGGPTPWGTWLSCEEVDRGTVWECDPMGESPAELRLALGIFQHEAAAVDPINEHVYMTEDQVDGRLYRYVPDDDSRDGRIDLDRGQIEVARVVSDQSDGPVEWLSLPDPTFTGDTPTRHQVPESTAFAGGEGLWYDNGVVYFTTKIDNRVWAYDIGSALLTILYDDDTSDTPILSGVDNLTLSAQGDILVAEDEGDMQIVALAPTGEIVPIMQLVGQDGSEVTGPAFDPSGRRLYFSSQRGPGMGSSRGITYEITGPFFV